MKCEQAQLLMNSLVDGEISVDDRVAVEAHIGECADCGETYCTMNTQDREVRQLFQPLREAGAQLADRVIADLPDVPGASAAQSPARSAGVISLLLAMAVGFLGAVVIFQPWKTPIPVVRMVHPPEPVPGQPANLTHFVAATGEIQVRTGAEDDWQIVPVALPFACPANAAVRTTDDARCELVTSDDCVIRMNSRTEVRFRSPSNVELRRGQIWCRAPDNVRLEVVPASADATANVSTQNKPLSAWSCTTPVSASFLTSIHSDGNAQVTTAGGEVSIKTRAGIQRLKTGDTATIAKGQVATTRMGHQPLALSWMTPLVVRKGHSDAELKQRVDQLLAGIGQSKVSSLYEREIRSLGEYCVLPLLRYLQSPQSKSQTNRRLKAMRIVSDLAPSWTIGDLIGLLDDEQAQVRFLVATALLRLTKLDQGCPPSSWRDATAECMQARADWQTWWNNNRDRFPQPGN